MFINKQYDEKFAKRGPSISGEVWKQDPGKASVQGTTNKISYSFAFKGHRTAKFKLFIRISFRAKARQAGLLGMVGTILSIACEELGSANDEKEVS